MSIKKKLSIFVLGLLLIPMLLLLLSTQHFFDQQIQENERNYLQVAMKTVRNDMENRMEEMRKAGWLFVGNSNLYKAIYDKDKNKLDLALHNLERNYSYLDYIAIVDRENRILVSSSPYLLYPDGSKIKVLAASSMLFGQTHVSEEVVGLGELFTKDSLEYNQFSIKILNQPAGAEEYLRKALMGIVIVPIRDRTANNEIIGAVILGDLLNNDNYFAERYSRNLDNSFLAFSIDGIRIASNIQTNTKNNFIGSRAPHGIGKYLADDKQYFGKVKVDDEVHVFLDQKIFNSAEEPIAIVGIGIPEEKFSGIVSNNYKYVLGLFFLCLLAMLILGQLLAEKISCPIVHVTDLTRDYYEKNFGNKAVLNGRKDDEGAILQEMFEKFTAQLELRKQESRLYLEQLECEHEHQKKLAAELQKNNEQLELNVAERTKYLQEALNELKKVDVAKSQFMANISHELRTPLNAIIGSADILKDDILGALNKKQEKYVANIYSSSTHLLQLINDILDISKIASGKMTLNYSEFYLKEIVLQTVENVKSYVVDKQLKVNLTFEPDDFMIEADAAKLKQILYNLLSNAVKFTRQGGEIEIYVYRREDAAEFIVRDNGIGIAEQDQARVFVEFEQVDSSYTREYEGTGLGLPLVKKMVEMHGGYVYLKSALGQGTEVIFLIPLQPKIQKQ